MEPSYLQGFDSASVSCLDSSDPQDFGGRGVFGQRLAFDEIFADGFE
jgi:hypothetical protein